MMSTLRRLTFAAPGLMLIAVLTSRSAAYGAQSAAEQARNHVEYFLNNQHGLNRLSAADRDLLAQMQATPETYVELIHPTLTLLYSDTVLQDETVKVHERALTLLGTLGGDQARASILQDYHALTARLRVLQGTTGDPASTRLGRIFLSLRRLALDELGRVGGIEVLGDVLNEVEAADAATQVVMLRYIARVGAGNSAALQRLYKIRGQPQSALAKSPALANTIEQLRNTSKPH